MTSAGTLSHGTNAAVKKLTIEEGGPAVAIATTSNSSSSIDVHLVTSCGDWWRVAPGPLDPALLLVLGFPPAGAGPAAPAPAATLRVSTSGSDPHIAVRTKDGAEVSRADLLVSQFTFAALTALCDLLDDTHRLFRQAEARALELSGALAASVAAQHAVESDLLPAVAALLEEKRRKNTELLERLRTAPGGGAAEGSPAPRRTKRARGTTKATRGKGGGGDGAGGRGGARRRVAKQQSSESDGDATDIPEEEGSSLTDAPGVPVRSPLLRRPSPGSQRPSARGLSRSRSPDSRLAPMERSSGGAAPSRISTASEDEGGFNRRWIMERGGEGVRGAAWGAGGSGSGLGGAAVVGEVSGPSPPIRTHSFLHSGEASGLGNGAGAAGTQATGGGVTGTQAGGGGAQTGEEGDKDMDWDAIMAAKTEPA